MEDVHIFHKIVVKFQPDFEEVNLPSMLETLNHRILLCATFSDLNEVGDRQEQLLHVPVYCSRLLFTKPNSLSEDFLSQSNWHFLHPLNFLHY